MNLRFLPHLRRVDRKWAVWAIWAVWAAMAGPVLAADFNDPNADRNALPTVPPGFEVSFFAREPLVRQPCSMAFDAQGRLCVGMGPQYRNPKPDTPGDSVVLVLDTNGDGAADRTKTFATGFNAIQALAWHGRDLWVANAPDLTVVRDLDGDDEADEYVRVYTDLGNLEHGLHGLNWAPDGMLYMSKGNSKGLTQPGRIAPKPFRELWGVNAPAGSPDFPPPRVFRKGHYAKAYHDPADDWGREGGVLRCDDGGKNLEIVSRGFRNPWDITFDNGFNWLGTDNDQTTGDRVFMPYFGAHFGWNHPWSAHWGTDPHPPSAPVSGPLFEGSGTGIVFGGSARFPASHRDVFFINDWLRKTTFVWRPRWDGALLRPAGGDWEPFVQGGKALFRPTDLEVGPDGALWILGWSAGYGAEYQDGQMSSEGRVFRVVSAASPQVRETRSKRSKPQEEWTLAELVEDFDGPLPVWRINAQDELLRRGDRVKADLLALVQMGGLSEARETWAAWTLSRMMASDQTLGDWFSARAIDAPAPLNLRVQALRILGHRLGRSGAGHGLPTRVVDLLRNPEPRLRFETVQAIRQARQRSAVPALKALLATERDSTVYYATWQTLRDLEDAGSLRTSLTDARAGVRKGVLLALLENHALVEADVRPMAKDTEPGVRDIAALWLSKAGAGGETPVVRGRPLNSTAPESAGANRRVSLARNLKVRSGAPYRIAPSGLRPGAKPYTDRGYEFKWIPDAFVDADYIQTANDDDGSRGDGWLRFEALVPVRVHIAFDARASTVPEWLRQHYRRSDQRIQADHWNFHIYSREFPAGQIELGGNTDDGVAGGKGNYIAVLEPLPLSPPAQPTALDAALTRLPQGDPARGEWLFHARGGAGCFNCHRLQDHGNSFGPALAALGDRATAKHIVQSMLEPNTVITEGFTLQFVETGDGEYSGVLLEESGVSVTLGLITGQREVLPKSRITSRRSASTSAMPAYATTLAPQYVADLTTYLLAQKDPRTNSRKSGDVASLRSSLKADTLASGNAFQFTEAADRLVISHSRQRVAEFVFHDEKIWRPYFANVHAPGGFKVTRNHPPLAGVDALDHDTMHPGIWLAFGDVSGVDFWRNRGRIEHIAFVESPEVRNGRLTFATQSQLRAPDGRMLCTMVSRFKLMAQPNAWLLYWDATFKSGESDFTFGDQEEMGFGARVASAIAEKNGGVITSSSGLTTAKGTWGLPAEWCDYSGTVEGRPVGLTLLSDPANFRPSWWHNRDYGVFVANPFGREALKQGPRSAVRVKRGEDFRVRFGAVIHAGAGSEAELRSAWLKELH